MMAARLHPVLHLAALSLAVASCGAPSDRGAAEDDGATTNRTADRSVRAAYIPERGDDWARKDPTEAGFDAAALDEAIDWALDHETTMPRDPGRYLRERFAGQRWQEIVGPTRARGGVNGVLLKDGYIVAEWGDTRRPDMTFSVTKSYLSTVVGLAWDDGLIPDLDAPVADLITDGGFDSPQNASITWRHHLQQLSEWEGTLFGKPDQADRREGVDRPLQRPGTFWEYNDVRVNRLALSALRLFQRPLPDVLRERVMDPIGASRDWAWHGYETSWVDVNGERMQSVSGGGHWGGGMVISTRDHARFGLLMQRRGLWGQRRLVSEEWVAQALTPSIQPNYGFMWWLNTDREQIPNAPESSFFALGAGSTSTIWIDPDRDLVLVSRWIDGPEVNELIGMILAAHDAPRPAAGLSVRFGPSFEKVFPDQDGIPASFGDRASVALARGEVEAIQLVIYTPADLEGVVVRAEALTGPGGVEMPAEDVEIRPIGYVNLLEARTEDGRNGWHPDPLFPNQPVDVSSGVPQSFLISVSTTAETPPGTYTGRIIIEAGRETVTRDLSVEVWDVTLPRTPRFKSASFASWSLPDRMWPVDLGYPVLDDSTRLDRMLQTADLGFAYRLPPTVFLANGLRSWNDGSGGRTEYGFPTHDSDGAGGGRFNAERTDRLIDFMLDRGANHFFLAVTANVWRPTGDSEIRRDRLVSYLTDYADHLRRRDLLHMAYVYNIDEPWGQEVTEAKQTYALIRDRVGRDVQVMQNTNQNNPEAIPGFLGFFDILDINLGFHDVTDIDVHRERHPDAIGDLWWNVNLWPDSHPNLFIEYPLVDARILGPLAYKHGVDGFEYWDVLWTRGIGNYYPVAPDDLWVEWDVDARSLDGTLVYPSRDFDIYPSLRLAGLRDGFEDLEMLYILEELDPENALLEVPIVSGLSEFTRDPDELLGFRRRVAEAIVEAQNRPVGRTPPASDGQG